MEIIVWILFILLALIVPFFMTKPAKIKKTLSQSHEIDLEKLDSITHIDGIPANEIFPQEVLDAARGTSLERDYWNGKDTYIWIIDDNPEREVPHKGDKEYFHRRLNKYYPDGWESYKLKGE